MTPEEKTQQRDKRILDALDLGTPDRIPLFMNGQGFFKFVDPEATLADYFRRPRYVDDLLIQAAQLPDLQEIDFAPACGTNTSDFQAAFASLYFAKVKLPGRELPENALWNIDELGPMTEEDYDTVIDKGWDYMTEELHRRNGFDPSTLTPPDPGYMKELAHRIAPLGKASPLRSSALLHFPPFETLSGARQLTKFFRDLRRQPDKVKAVLEIMEDYFVAKTIQDLQKAPPSSFAFVGGTRCGSGFISAQVFERFYFPFYRKLIPAMEAIGVKAWLHMDNDWSGFLHYFREFSKGQCIWAADQMTDITKVKEVLGDRMCITGNLPAAMFSIGTPDESYRKTRELCELMGKSGFIMAAGCSVPIDAKRENVAAVIAATLDC